MPSEESPTARHPHLGRPCPPGRLRVDCHLHTMYSGDAVTTIDELVEHVEACGLDVVCVTDHHSVRGALASVERLASCRVIVGEELRTGAGEVIGLFLSERVPHGIDVSDAAGRIRAQGGLVYVPHPGDPVRHSLDGPRVRELCAKGLVDVIEVFNAKSRLDHLNESAAALAADLGLPGGAGSDAHDPAAIGAAFVEVPEFDGPADFVRALGEGSVVGHRFDRPREFRPRVIPKSLRQA